MACEVLREVQDAFIQTLLDELKQLIQEYMHKLFDQIRHAVIPYIIQWGLSASIKLLSNIGEPLLTSRTNDMLLVNCSSTASSITAEPGVN